MVGREHWRQIEFRRGYRRGLVEGAVASLTASGLVVLGLVWSGVV